MRRTLTRCRSFGLRYTTLAALRALAGRSSRALAGAVDRLEEQLLAIEGERTILGPAHRAFAGHSSHENRAVWDSWDWSRRGEEWDDTAQPEAWGRA